VVRKEELRGENISSFGSVCEILEIYGAVVIVESETFFRFT